MIERAYNFGPGKSLVGIWTEPAGFVDARSVPVTLCLNAGLLHRVGPSRLYVQLCRRLAALGYPTFRFDFSGIGDSDGLGDGLAYEARMVRDVKAAMDFLATRFGAARFIPLGLCSGADAAHRTAVADQRVTAAVFLDGYVYPTLGYYRRRYGRQLFNPKKWLSVAARLWTASNPVSADETAYRLDLGGCFPPRHQVQRDLEQLVERGVRLLYVYSGGFENYYNYHEQFRDTFRGVDFADRLRVDYLVDVDHTFILESDRRCLIDLVTAWMREHDKANPAPAVASINVQRQ